MKKVLKWSGSKNIFAKEIINLFPKYINTYYEPFVGGGSIIGNLICRPDINVDKYICSDLCKPLIDLYNLIIEDPIKLFNYYKSEHKKFRNDREHYYKTRDFFNKNKDPYSLFFLCRTCYNGLIRFNSKGEFNTPVHFSRSGIDPGNLLNIIRTWSLVLKNVEFKNCSFTDINQKNKDDFIYLDPPYIGSSSMYFGSFDFDIFFKWVEKLKCKYILSFGRGEVPKNLYKTKIDLSSTTTSTFTKLLGYKTYHEHYLYMNFDGKILKQRKLI